MKVFLALVVSIVALAGCTEKIADGPVDEAPRPLAQDGSESPGALPGGTQNDSLAVANQFMQATNCHGFGGAHSFLGDTNPARPPPGWEQDVPTEGLGSDLIFEIMACDRVSWGPFERPLTILLETHSNTEPPEACKEGSPSNVLYGLVRMWISDPEVASWANETYGMPTLVLDSSESLDSVGPADAQAWTWSANGLPPSRAEFRTTAALGNSSAQIPQRIAWISGGHLWLGDIIREPTQHLGGQPDAYPIELHEPMLLATVSPAPPIVRGDYVFSTPMTYTFQEFGDYQCKSPA